MSDTDLDTAVSPEVQSQDPGPPVTDDLIPTPVAPMPGAPFEGNAGSGSQVVWSVPIGKSAVLRFAVWLQLRSRGRTGFVLPRQRRRPLTSLPASSAVVMVKNVSGASGSKI